MLIFTKEILDMSDKKTVKLPELLSPAGNFEKLRTAISYGADAVYFAGQAFGMRAAADNFTLDEMREAIAYAHAHSAKAYITVNTLPLVHEIAPLREYLKAISEFDEKPDALIVADLGVASMVREILPMCELHVSTQAGITNHLDCIEWAKLGASRMVLARELSLSDIIQIRQNIPESIELEAFVHGSMCVSFSGRCLLSNHFTGRDANRGQCTQPCRWNYKLYEIEEEKRPDDRLPIMETDRGSFIMSSRDMCMIRRVPELIEAGIASFKIEGRMKSAYYAAVTANAYRMAIDAYRDGKDFDERWLRELDSVSHREYCEGYFFESPLDEAQICSSEGMKTGYIREKSYVAVVKEFDSEKMLAKCIQRNKISKGEVAEIISPGLVGREFAADELYDAEGREIESAPHPMMEFYVKLPFEAKEGDIIRK